MTTTDPHTKALDFIDGAELLEIRATTDKIREELAAVHETLLPLVARAQQAEADVDYATERGLEGTKRTRPCVNGCSA